MLEHMQVTDSGGDSAEEHRRQGKGARTTAGKCTGKHELTWGVSAIYIERGFARSQADLCCSCRGAADCSPGQRLGI